jgi:hypothetical protein
MVSTAEKIFRPREPEELNKGAHAHIRCIMVMLVATICCLLGFVLSDVSLSQLKNM